MTKEEIYSFLLSFPKGNLQEIFFKKKFPEHYQILSTWEFPSDFKFTQKLYHYFNEDPELKLGLCPICGKRCGFIRFSLGYYKHCSTKCSSIDLDVQEKNKESNIKKFGTEHAAQSNIIKEKTKNTNRERYNTDYVFQSTDIKNKIRNTLLERYGVDNPSKDETIMRKVKSTNIERYGVEYYFQSDDYKQKCKDTCLSKYNEEYYSQSEDFKKGIKNTYDNKSIEEKQEINIKRENTCLVKYGFKHYSETNECKKKIKDTSLNRYGTEYYSQTNECKIKSYKVKKENNSFNTSKIENELSDWLKKNNFSFISQYTSNLYPYNCDFYLIDYDLYIEIQGIWTHGNHPFNENDNNDIKKVKVWKKKSVESRFYKEAIDVWTHRDVEKRNIAKQNNLNYLEIFSIDLDYCIEQIFNRIKSGV